MNSLLLLPIANTDRALLGRLAGILSHHLHVQVTLGSATLDPAPAYDLSRSQYNSTALLVEILKHYAAFEGKILGVCNVDLFVPVLTYVFGEAQLDGKVSILSTFRLDDRLYGFPPNQKLYEERIVKEAMHEIGHTLGLYHCRDYRCVMHSSTAVEEIDLKGELYCANCEGDVARTRNGIATLS